MMNFRSTTSMEEFYERYCSIYQNLQFVCLLSNLTYKSTCSSLQHFSFSVWHSDSHFKESFHGDVEGLHIPSSGISAGNVPLPPRILVASCAAVGRALPAGSGWEPFPSAYGETTTGSAVSSSGPLNTRETWTYWIGSNEGQRDGFGTGTSLL